MVAVTDASIVVCRLQIGGFSGSVPGVFIVSSRSSIAYGWCSARVPGWRSCRLFLSLDPPTGLG